MIAIFALAHGDPYLGLYAVFIGVGTVGILLLYASGAVAVFGFLRFKVRDPRLWQGVISPLLALAGLLAATYLSIHNFTSLTGSTSDLVNALWLLPFIVLVVGYLIAAVRYRGVDPAVLEAGLESDLDIAADLDPMPAPEAAGP